MTVDEIILAHKQKAYIYHKKTPNLRYIVLGIGFMKVNGVWSRSATYTDGTSFYTRNLNNFEKFMRF